MKKINPGANFAVFVLFFGVAFLEVFQTANWAMALFWTVIGLIFLVGDKVRKNKVF